MEGCICRSENAGDCGSHWKPGGRRGLLPGGSRGSQPCRHLDSRLSASRIANCETMGFCCFKLPVRESGSPRWRGLRTSLWPLSLVYALASAHKNPAWYFSCSQRVEIPWPESTHHPWRKHEIAEPRGHPQGHVRTWQGQTAHLIGAMTSTARSQDKESEDPNADPGCVSFWPGEALPFLGSQFSYLRNGGIGLHGL